MLRGTDKFIELTSGPYDNDLSTLSFHLHLFPTLIMLPMNSLATRSELQQSSHSCRANEGWMGFVFLFAVSIEITEALLCHWELGVTLGIKCELQ